MTATLAMLGLLAALAAALGHAASKLRLAGIPLAGAGLLAGAAVASAGMAAVGIRMDDYRDAAVALMIVALSLSLAAIGLRSAANIASMRSLPVMALAAILVAIESCIPFVVGSIACWDKPTIAALGSNAAAMATAVASDPTLATPHFLGAFGVRYLIQMLLPLLLLGWLLRRKSHADHHSRKCRAYQRATDGPAHRIWQIAIAKPTPLASVLALAEVQRIDRGGTLLRPADLDGDLAPGDVVAVLCESGPKDQILALVGGRVEPQAAVRLPGLIFVAAFGCGLSMLGLQLGGAHIHVGLPVGVLVAAIIAGLVSTPRCDLHQPASVLGAMRTVGLAGFLAATGLALGYQAQTLGIGEVVAYALTSIATSAACWCAALYGGHLILGRGSPPLRAVGVLAGATTSSGLAETATARSGSEVAAIAFAAAYPIGSLAKVVIVQLILAR